MIPARALDPTHPPELIGTCEGALLAGVPILLALHERGIAARMSVLGEDPLAEALSKTLAARALPSVIERAPDPSTSSILIGDGALLDHPVLGELGPRALVAIVGLGAEACAGHDPARAPRALLACLAEGSLVHRSMLHPFDPIVRAWLEIVEDVHHAVGPALQRPIVDAVRAALMGRHGAVAVDLAARDRPAIVGLETATISWVRPSAMR